MKKRITRREFGLGLSALTAATLFSNCAIKPTKPKAPITGGFANEDGSNFGHKLRDGKRFTMPTRIKRVPIIIVGGGMSGLSAAWRLDKSGFTNFILLEMERQIGGTSRSGEDSNKRVYPWAAHYVPVPNVEATSERELLSDLGVLLPGGKWNPEYICKRPQERLFIGGAWQDGLEPRSGFGNKDREEFSRWHDMVHQFRSTGGFTLPLEVGRNAKHQELDQISIGSWLRQQGFSSPLLYWFIEYGCRDDYGSGLENTSAWAAIHYEAARQDPEDRVFTWPEGNGWIVKRLQERLSKYIHTETPVWKIKQNGNKVDVFTETTHYVADSVIFTGPTFLAQYIIEGMEKLDRSAWVSSPWLTANITLSEPPQHSIGAPLSWDNVLFDSPALGYVSAAHQSGQRNRGAMVWTYYRPFPGDPTASRMALMQSRWEDWRDEIVKDLSVPHPDIAPLIQNVDVMRMGHAMIRPVIGSIFHEQRIRLQNMPGPIFLANTDLSGVALFEQANYRGVTAAENALHYLRA